MQFFSILLTLYLCNRAVRIDKCPCMFARAFSSFQRTLYLCDDKSVVLLCRLMCMSEKLFCFVQMNKAKEKSFRSIRRNEWTQCSPHLRRHWSYRTTWRNFTLPFVTHHCTADIDLFLSTWTTINPLRRLCFSEIPSGHKSRRLLTRRFNCITKKRKGH